MTSRPDEVTAAIQELWRKLQIASAYSPAQPDHGRGCARIALIGVLEFLSILFPKTPTLPLALEDLLQGLVDLDRGTVIRLLAPADLRGRPPDPLSSELFRALVAAAMTIVMNGMGREAAARNIAGRLEQAGLSPRPDSACENREMAGENDVRIRPVRTWQSSDMNWPLSW